MEPVLNMTFVGLQSSLSEKRKTSKQTKRDTQDYRYLRNDETPKSKRSNVIQTIKSFTVWKRYYDSGKSISFEIKSTCISIW